MRCAEAVHQLQLYIDSRLTVKQTRALEAHVAGCAACQRELALLEEVAQSVHNLKLVAEPVDLAARIMQRVALDSRRPSTPRFSLLRLSPLELLTAISLATIATIGSILAQPSVRILLPFANGKSMRTDGWARMEPMVAIVASEIAVSSSSGERRRSEKRGVLGRRESRATRCMMRAARSTGSATSLRLCTL